jgi:DNA modification methylase
MPGDIVLDQMMGSGTTLVECKLLSRNAVGVDVNPDAVMLSRSRLDFSCDLPKGQDTEQRTFIGDARNLDKIEDASIDLIATHPPYGNIISYSEKTIAGDLSGIDDFSEYVGEMRKVADEAYRVLKPGKYCAVLMGDTRKNKHYVPIAQRAMERFLDAGFVLKEDIIKRQWRCKTTGFWVEKSRNYNFLLIMHEHLYIFRKPEDGEDAEKYRY